MKRYTKHLTEQQKEKKQKQTLQIETSLSQDLHNFRVWLKVNQLEQYYPLLVSQEVVKVDYLTLLTKNEIVDLAQKAGMGIKVRSRFYDAIQRISTTDSYIISPTSSKERSSAKNIMCTEHSEPAKLICVEDDVLMCLICMATTHYGHKGKSIMKVFHEEKDEIAFLIAKAKHRTIEVEACVKKFKARQSKVKKRKELIKKNIRMFFDGGRHAWNERESELLMQVEDIINNKIKVLDQQISMLLSEYDNIQSVIHKAEELLSIQKEVHLFQVGSLLRKQLTTVSDYMSLLVPETDKSISFSANRSILKSIVSCGQVGVMSNMVTPASIEHSIEKPNKLVREDAGKSIETINLTNEEEKPHLPLQTKSSTRVSVLLAGKPIFESAYKLPKVQGCQSIFFRMWGGRGSKPGQFNNPSGVAVSGDAVYVVDNDNHRVQVFHHNGTLINTWGSQGSKQGQFSYPFCVTLNGSTIYVADENNHRIQVFHRNGSCINFVRMWGSKGSGKGQFHSPVSVAVNGDCIYVADYMNTRIQVFHSDGTFVRMWGEKGVNQGQFSCPISVAVNDNTVYVADFGNDRIQVFRPDGTFLRMWGSNGTKSGQFSCPYDVAVDGDFVYVADSSNNRIQVFLPNGTFVREWGSNDAGPVHFFHPCCVAVDNGIVCVADRNHSVQLFR